MQVKLKDLKKDTTMYYLKSSSCTILASGSVIYKMYKHPAFKQWHMDDEDEVSVEKAKLGVEVDSVWIDELEGNK